ncbi:unnamed protein product [Lathyrus oleraceus]
MKIWLHQLRPQTRFIPPIIPHLHFLMRGPFDFLDPEVPKIFNCISMLYTNLQLVVLFILNNIDCFMSSECYHINILVFMEICDADQHPTY